MFSSNKSEDFQNVVLLLQQILFHKKPVLSSRQSLFSLQATYHLLHMSAWPHRVTFLKLQLRWKKQGRQKYRSWTKNQSHLTQSIQLNLLLVKPRLRFKSNSNYSALPIFIDSIDHHSSNKPGYSSLSGYSQKAEEPLPHTHKYHALCMSY